jgi:hypothetical protein
MNTTKLVRVRNLPDRPAPGVKLYCPHCAGEYSATRGDYFMASPDTVMSCCEAPMLLVRETRRLVMV